MWYGHCCPRDGFLSRLLDRSNPPQPQYRVPYYPGWRQYQYLPLQGRSGNATGLTVYMKADSMVGIAAHGTGSSRVLVGTREGVPVHFPLDECNRLLAAWFQESRVGTMSHHGFLTVRSLRCSISCCVKEDNLLPFFFIRPLANSAYNNTKSSSKKPTARPNTSPPSGRHPTRTPNTPASGCA